MALILDHLTNSTNKEVSEVLMRSAVRSAKHGIEHFKSSEGGSAEMDFAVIHLAHAVELTLKSVLARQARLLLVERVDDLGAVRTIDVSKCLKRLKTQGLDVDQDNEERIREIRNIRNDIEHFYSPNDLSYVRKALDSIVGVWLAIFNKYDCGDLCQMLNTEEFDFVKGVESRYKQALEKALEDMRAKAAEYNTNTANRRDFSGPFQCRKCAQKTVIHSNGQPQIQCFFCNWEMRIDRCHECRLNKFVSYYPDSMRWLCNPCASADYTVQSG